MTLWVIELTISYSFELLWTQFNSLSFLVLTQKYTQRYPHLIHIINIYSNHFSLTISYWFVLTKKIYFRYISIKTNFIFLIKTITPFKTPFNQWIVKINKILISLKLWVEVQELKWKLSLNNNWIIPQLIERFLWTQIIYIIRSFWFRE